MFNMKKELTIQEKEMFARDKIFKSHITSEKLKHLCVRIQQYLANGRDLEEICILTGLSLSQINYVQSQPAYYQSQYNLIDKPNDIVNSIISSNIVEITETMCKGAKQGDSKLIALVMNQIKNDTSNQNQTIASWTEFLDMMGISTSNNKATDLIRKAKELKQSQDNKDTPIEVEVISNTNTVKDIEDDSIDVENDSRESILDKLIQEDT